MKCNGIRGSGASNFPGFHCVTSGLLAYLAIRIAAATKAGRSPKDAARFAVALYHGMRSMVVAAQTAVKNDIDWAPVEAELLKQGYTDQVAYVNEVVI